MRRRTRKRGKYIRKTKKLNRKHKRHKKQKHRKKTNKQHNKKQKHHKKQKHYLRTKQKHHRRTKHQRGGDDSLNTQHGTLTSHQKKLKKMYCIMINPKIPRNEDAFAACTLPGNYKEIIMGGEPIEKKTIKIIAKFLWDMKEKQIDNTESIGETLKYIINDHDLRNALKYYPEDIKTDVGSLSDPDGYPHIMVQGTYGIQWNKELIKKINYSIKLKGLDYDSLSIKDRLKKIKKRLMSMRKVSPESISISIVEEEEIKLKKEQRELEEEERKLKEKQRELERKYSFKVVNNGPGFNNIMEIEEDEINNTGKNPRGWARLRKLISMGRGNNTVNKTGKKYITSNKN